MLVTFKAQGHANVLMFGDPALTLLRLMGRTDSLPSAMEPEDIPNALRLLRKGIGAEDEVAQGDAFGETEDENDQYVSLTTRAQPVIELLQAAYEDKVMVVWVEGAQAY